MYSRISLLFSVGFFLLISGSISAADQQPTLLLRNPTLSNDHVAFIYACDLWIADIDGGNPRRLTVHPGEESNPCFSPDGKRIAFTGDYDGNVDVYLVPVEGGSPVRLTYHPNGDLVRGWTPDGKSVLFRSTRISDTSRYGRLFTVPFDGGFPEPLVIPVGERAAFSPDGSRIAYTPLRDAFGWWKRYRGGRVPPIWIFDLATHEIEEIPHGRASDTWPMWVGETVYFLSDRNYTMNIFAYDTRTKAVTQVTYHEDHDVKSARAHGNAIIYEQAGRLHLLDTGSGTVKTLDIRISPDLPSTRPHYEKASDFITWYEISSSGVRALFEARGDIFTVPAEKGDIRNLTRTPGVHERSPSWSPKGDRIAYFSDANGEYQLMLQNQSGIEPPEVIDLGDTTFFYDPIWSPDGEKILFYNKRLELYYLDLKKRRPVHVDTEGRNNRTFSPNWSPDSHWIAYTRTLANDHRAVFVFDLKKGTSQQITDGMSDVISAAFSRDGKYLYFAASTNFALNTSDLDMSSYERTVRRSIYLVVLNDDDPSPFAPESDEEETDKGANDKEEEGEEEEDKEVEVVIDFKGLDQRILALDLPEGDYSILATAEEGKLFYLEDVSDDNGQTLHRFDLAERESKVFLDGVEGYVVSQDGKKLLYKGTGDAYGIVAVDDSPSMGDSTLSLSDMEIYVDPRAEWEQMFRQAWRLQRDFFYDPGMHGLDWQAVYDKYSVFLPHVSHRADLNYLIGEMIGELTVGHAYVGGGDHPEVEKVETGLLGADYKIANDYYRFSRIFTGENWNPDLRAPLTEPGVDIKVGDYLLAVNGQPVRTPQNIYGFFVNTAGKQTVLKVNSKPSLNGARNVTVVPISSENGLRLRAWVENNRRTVDELTDGRVAYVYLPNTGWDGYTYFNRYFYAQKDKQAVIFDERYNSGGSAADYMIDMMKRSLLSYWVTRERAVYMTPNAALNGPRVMIINESAGSGGDALPLYFRRSGLGKLVGKRTWGGLIGYGDSPTLMDGGFVTLPSFAVFSPDGKWEVENEGVWPDIEVEMTPKAVIAGHDPQLEKAVEVILEELEKNPPPKPSIPPYDKRALEGKPITD